MQADQAIDTVDLGGRSADFSIWGMFIEADIIVQLVIVMLVLASFWSWAIMYEKIIRLRKVNAHADQFEEVFWSGNSLDNLFESMQNRADHPMAMVFISAMREWQRSIAGRSSVGNKLGLQDRIAKVMRVTMNRELERLEHQLGFLATVGSTAPFIGLFGTVWGIMNSFQAIALTSNTSLAVVAPGIAEALMATALGLVAAIPAVMAYNKLSADVERYASRVEGFSEEFSAILSRQLEESHG